jgi:hypothetical protein
LEDDDDDVVDKVDGGSTIMVDKKRKYSVLSSRPLQVAGVVRRRDILRTRSSLFLIL